jgi:biopolymer transport protein ExbB
MTTNAYGLQSLWEQGDWITKSVAIFLLGMSVLSWSVIVMKSIQMKRLDKQAKSAEESLQSERGWQTSSTDNSQKNSFNPFQNLLHEGLKATSYHRLYRHQFNDAVPKGEWINPCLQRTIDTISQKLQADLPILASIGSTAPFVGLFGTVWGIYHALIKISISGQSSIDQIAGPVGESLIMTAFGLVVAIPAVLGYNALLQNHKKLMNHNRRYAHELQVRLIVENVADYPVKQKQAKIRETQGVGV